MGLFDPPRPKFDILEVEDSMPRVLARVKDFLAKNSPSMIWTPAYAKTVGWKSLSIKRGNPFYRGLAYYATGNIELRLDHSLRWMDNSNEVSTLYAQEDLTPTGVLAHELGHQFEWALRRTGNAGKAVVEKFFALKRTTAVSAYGRTKEQEDWAEAYRLFVLNPPLLKRLSPDRYKLFLMGDAVMIEAGGIKQGVKRSPAVPATVMARLDHMMAQGEEQ